MDHTYNKEMTKNDRIKVYYIVCMIHKVGNEIVLNTSELIMLKTLPITPSRTSQKLIHRSQFIIFSCLYA